MKKALGYDAYEIMAAGINKNERPGWTGKRVAGPDITIHSAPYIEVVWNEELFNSYIKFTVTDVETGIITTEYDIPFTELGY